MPPEAGRKPYPRWLLRLQAVTMRFLMKVGMLFHALPEPRPASPSFTVYISTTLSAPVCSIPLVFYVPPSYNTRARRTGQRFRTILNFHGGGFTLGTATDDGRWTRAVMEEVPDAVIVSVGYRLAPEYPFPCAVDDGIDALLWLAAHADEYALSMHDVALTGFSAGANLAFTVPLRLQAYMRSNIEHMFKDLPHESLPNIKAIVAFYPILDYTMSRDERRALCSRPELTLPPSLTNLFDDSYLPAVEDKFSSSASPVAASDAELANLPPNISLFLCEWDMLLKEGREFADRLARLGKNSKYQVVERVRHAWDRSPNPFKVHSTVNYYYKSACADLMEAL